MMPSWILYGSAVACILALAACAAESGLRPWKLPARWVWLAALLASLVLPAAARLAPASSPLPTAPRIAGVVEDAPARAIVPITRVDGLAHPSASWEARMERPVRIAWLTLSGLFAATLLLSAWQLRRSRRGWTRAMVADTPVLVSERLGPAVVGLLRPAIVLPRWALDADEHTQRLMVAHEREHLAAGDGWLLAAALGCLALIPWNLPAWWIVRRLRHAIELDCDRRVLRRGVESRAYGDLLLRVSQGPAPGFAVAIPLLGEPVSYLERRIRAMTSRMPRHPRLLTGAAGLAAGLVLSSALLVPRPAAALERAADGPGRSAAAQDTFNLDTIPVEQVRAALAQWHPELLRASDPKVMVYFVTNRAGVVQKSLVVPLAEMEHGVVTREPRRRPIRVAQGQRMVFDSTNSGSLPVVRMVPGRNVMAEIRADVVPNRIERAVMWTSHAVPGGIEVGWVTLKY
jgi:beta-lactamase regulating signal transducer with metallopeptidase domain